MLEIKLLSCSALYLSHRFCIVHEGKQTENLSYLIFNMIRMHNFSNRESYHIPTREVMFQTDIPHSDNCLNYSQLRESNLHYNLCGMIIIWEASICSTPYLLLPPFEDNQSLLSFLAFQTEMKIGKDSLWLFFASYHHITL